MNLNKSEISRGILGVLAVAGVLTIAVAAPGIFTALGHYKSLRSYKRTQLKRSLRTLEKNRFVEISYKDGKTQIRLTKEGKEKLVSFQLDEMKIQKPKRWDRKWRIVIFDVPEKFQLNRKIFRQKLIELGFKMLQKSVWICPYPCEDEIDFLKEVYEIRRFVRVITADNIDIHSDLEKYFGLP